MKPTFGQWLRAQRKAAGLTLTQLGEKAGTFASVLSEIEAGGRRPSADVAGRVARALKLDAQDVLALAGIITRGALMLLRRDVALVAKLNRAAALDKALAYINTGRAHRAKRKAA